MPSHEIHTHLCLFLDPVSGGQNDNIRARVCVNVNAVLLYLYASESWIFNRK